MDTRSGRTGIADQYRVSTSPNQRTQYAQQIPNILQKRSIDHTKVTSIDKSLILAEVQNQNAELRSVRANLFKEAEIGFEKISHLLKNQNAQQENYQGRRFNSQDKYQNHENDARYEQIRNQNISSNGRFRPHLDSIKPGYSEQIAPLNSSKISSNKNQYSRQSEINETLQPITKKINLAYTSDEFNSNLGIQQDSFKTYGISPSSRFVDRDRLNIQDEEIRKNKNKNQDQHVSHSDPKQGSGISSYVQKGEIQSKRGLGSDGFKMSKSQILERVKNINTSNLHTNQQEVPQKSENALFRQPRGDLSQKYLNKFSDEDISMAEGLIRTTCDSNSKFSGGISKVSLDSNNNGARGHKDLNNLMSRDQNKLKMGYSSPVDTSIIAGYSDWQKIQPNDQSQVQQRMKQNEDDFNSKLRPQNAQIAMSNTEYFTLDQRFPGEKEQLVEHEPQMKQTHPQGYLHQDEMLINSQLNQNIKKYSASNDYKMYSENLKKQINSRDVSSDKQSGLQTEQTYNNIAALENNRIIKDKQPSQVHLINQPTSSSQNISPNNEISVKRSEFYDQVQKRQNEDTNLRENENEFYVQRKKSLEEILQPAEWKDGQEQETQYNQNVYKKNTHTQQGRSRRENELEQIVEKLLVELRMTNKFVSFLEFENKQLAEQNKQFCEQNQQQNMNQTDIFNEQNMKDKQIEKLNDTSFNNQKNYDTEQNGQEHSFFPAYQENQQHDSNNFQKYDNQQHSNIYDTGLMKMKQDFDNKIKEIEVLKSQSKDNSSNIDNLSRVNNELISQNILLEEKILQKDRQIGTLQTSLEKQNESLTEPLNKLELENQSIREMYSSEVRRMKEEELREFQELENKVRETILKKDDCIQKLNDVIADLLQNKTNKTYYY